MSSHLSQATQISGFIGACLVDSDTGLMLASQGGGPLDLEMVAAVNTDFLRSKLHAIDALGLNDELEDIVISLGEQVHLIRPLQSNRSLFVYLALDRKTSNLGLARIKLRAIEDNLKL